ncbi:hypothetical protein E0F88_07890 [Dyadobacter psychrotolerans]|uniref:Uncharacterized protein n=1 Tax=Dyadobacter psychrotolerans TaxID=2541721 RepID=A0A4R5DP94_9BACT|nr:hypothetical protein E0F88_07890 [Dyadobacter psychrotolerans]
MNKSNYARISIKFSGASTRDTEITITEFTNVLYETKKDFSGTSFEAIIDSLIGGYSELPRNDTTKTIKRYGEDVFLSSCGGCDVLGAT